MTVLGKRLVPAVIATAAPAVTDDETKGYKVGMWWFDTTHISIYWCKSITTGAADWESVTGGGGGGGTVLTGADAAGSGVSVYDAAGSSSTVIAIRTLLQGANTTITDNGDGTITIASSGGGGGAVDPGLDYDTLITGLSGIVGHWRMNEALAATVAIDMIGGNNLSRLGADVAGMPGGVLGSYYGSWRTTSGLRNTAPTGLPLGATARTMIAWVRSTSSANGAMAFGYGSAGTRNAFIFYMNGSASGDFNMSAYSDDIAIQGLAWNDNNWHMLAVTYDGSTGGVLYFDGQKVATHTFGGALTTALNGDGIWAGASAAAGGFGSVMTGQIDKLSLFNVALTDANITSLWKAAKGIA